MKQINELHNEKTGFLPMEKTKTQISCAVTAQLISAFVFATQYNSSSTSTQNFRDSNLLLKLYRLVCVGPGQKSRRPVFSHCGKTIYQLHDNISTNLYRNDTVGTVLSVFSYKHSVYASTSRHTNLSIS